MTITQQHLRTVGGPTYRALAEVIEQRIQGGEIPPGERLPAQRDLAESLKVTVGTIGRAYEILIERGLVRGEVGRGTYVLEQAPRPAERLHLEPAAQGEPLDLTRNVPAPIPAQQALSSLLAGLGDMALELSDYPPTIGGRGPRLAAASWLAEQGVPVPAERVVLTPGAQGAIAATLLAITKPGDTLLVEALSYPGLLSLARTLRLQVEPVAMDEDGIRPDALAALARQGGARAIVLSPTVQNPTTARLPAARRAQVADIAREHELMIVEDEVYGAGVARPETSLQTLAPERTFFISGLAKILAPGLRAGILAVPDGWLERVALAQADLCLGPSTLSSEVMARIITSGLLRQAAAEQRLALAERQALAARVLAGLPLRQQAEALHVWLPLGAGRDSDDLAMGLAARGVRVAPGSRFRVGRGGERARGLRLSLGGVRELPRLETALIRVREALTETERPYAPVL